MQTDSGNTKERSEEQKRDLKLENTVGNLFIAEHQVDRLRTRLADIITGYTMLKSKTKNHNRSSHVFKHKNKWYKISLKIDEMDVVSSSNEKQEANK